MFCIEQLSCHIFVSESVLQSNKSKKKNTKNHLQRKIIYLERNRIGCICLELHNLPSDCIIYLWLKVNSPTWFLSLCSASSLGTQCILSAKQWNTLAGNHMNRNDRLILIEYSSHIKIRGAELMCFLTFLCCCFKPENEFDSVFVYIEPKSTCLEKQGNIFIFSWRHLGIILKIWKAKTISLQKLYMYISLKTLRRF